MDAYINLAKSALEQYVKNRKILNPPANLESQMLKRKAGVFVTIFNKHLSGEQLRGCIGTFLSTQENIAKEIIENAIAAGTRDYRFAPIRKQELSQLSYEVSILSEPVLVQNPETELDPKKFGLIVRTNNGRSGLLLPDIEGVNMVKEQFSICCRKGGIKPNSDSFTLYKFSVEKHS